MKVRSFSATDSSETQLLLHIRESLIRITLDKPFYFHISTDQHAKVPIHDKCAKLAAHELLCMILLARGTEMAPDGTLFFIFFGMVRAGFEASSQFEVEMSGAAACTSQFVEGVFLLFDCPPVKH